jgi:hypothetical protein
MNELAAGTYFKLAPGGELPSVRVAERFEEH